MHIVGIINKHFSSLCYIISIQLHRSNQSELSYTLKKKILLKVELYNWIEKSKTITLYYFSDPVYLDHHVRDSHHASDWMHRRQIQHLHQRGGGGSVLRALLQLLPELVQTHQTEDISQDIWKRQEDRKRRQQWLQQRP